MHHQYMKFRGASIDTRLDVEVAIHFWERAIGLLGRKSLEKGRGLLLMPCASIHTCFMRFPIDVVFLGDAGRVTGRVTQVAPFRFVVAPAGTRSVLELAAGETERIGIREDMVLGVDPEHG